ncbi:MAG: hypothetical protein HYT98_02020 [Candidatus Sungbacteria bacterium]|nr:hypothetical protein [Candidatus Sungbacteria bacterium]
MKRIKRAKGLFLLVIAEHQKKVLEFWFGPDASNFKGKDIERYDTMILGKFDELRKKYPESRHDVVLGVAEDAHAVRKAFPGVSGWENVPVSDLKLATKRHHD